MKKILAVILTLLMMLTLALTAACEPVVENYESDTFELGESSRY